MIAKISEFLDRNMSLSRRFEWRWIRWIVLSSKFRWENDFSILERIQPHNDHNSKSLLIIIIHRLIWDAIEKNVCIFKNSPPKNESITKLKWNIDDDCILRKKQNTTETKSELYLFWTNLFKTIIWLKLDLIQSETILTIHNRKA